jgi:predicted nucleic acid-binding protein
MKIQNLTAKIAKCTGILNSKDRNISIVDCTIAATAIEAHARVLSDDPHFDAITEAKRAWI